MTVQTFIVERINPYTGDNMGQLEVEDLQLFKRDPNAGTARIVGTETRIVVIRYVDTDDFYTGSH